MKGTKTVLLPKLTKILEEMGGCMEKTKESSAKYAVGFITDANRQLLGNLLENK